MKSEFSRRQFHAVGPAHPHRMPGCRVVVYVVRVGSDWNISWSTHLRRYEQCSFSGCLLSEMPGSDQLFTNQFKLLAVCLLRIWSKKTRESIALTAWRQIAEAAKLTSYLWDFALVCFVNYRLTREKVGTNAEIFFSESVLNRAANKDVQLYKATATGSLSATCGLVLRQNA